MNSCARARIGFFWGFLGEQMKLLNYSVAPVSPSLYNIVAVLSRRCRCDCGLWIVDTGKSSDQRPGIGPGCTCRGHNLLPTDDDGGSGRGDFCGWVTDQL